MRLVFIYGPPASGKFTIGKIVAERTGMALFHNHLVVDAVGSVFPFATPSFVRLRERFWLDVFAAAAKEDRSLVFTFQPEPSVAEGFADRTADLVASAGGDVVFVRLTLSLDEQLARLGNESRSEFGKLRDSAILKAEHKNFVACEARMPRPRLTLDTAAMSADEAADSIVSLLA